MDKAVLSGLQKLNQLRLTPQEEDTVLSFFKRLGEGEDMLTAFDTSEVERMVHVIPLVNVLREDREQKLFSREDLLKGAPEQSEGYWQVPRLVE